MMAEITSKKSPGGSRSPWFVLVYGDPNIDDYGSYIIRQGRSRSEALAPDEDRELDAAE
jgi:hypothetical protein